MFAVIRIRGCNNVRKEIEDTMRLLNLTRVHHLVLVDETNEIKGMLKKAESYITWGEIKPEVIEQLLQKRGRLQGNKRLDEEFLKQNKLKDFKEFAERVIKDRKELIRMGVKPVFRLTPPKKGFERKGIKKSFSVGGALGYRGTDINSLIEKMI